MITLLDERFSDKICCSPDPTTNSETKNLDFYDFFNQYDNTGCGVFKGGIFRKAFG
jgi:hypothetical protein